MNPNTGSISEFMEKMKASGARPEAIQAFAGNYGRLISGETGLVPESSISPVADLQNLDEVSRRRDESLLRQSAILKLNGGLGTSMGLEGPKSLLRVKNELTFLDIIVRQILDLRKRFHSPLRFLLMNSSSTSSETLAYLERYREVLGGLDLEVMQSVIPKIDASSLRPVSWPADPELEWCPPGHGDIYPSLIGSGWLDRLLQEGVRYLFVSNSDNLGASLDLGLLTYFAQSGLSFLMEVTDRTAIDRKGGHLARRADGRLLLRESAQCPPSDMEAFQDIERHRFFNTNNLWIQLEHLQEVLRRNHGTLPLPIIKNAKTVDPRDKNSPKVIQLETAMGAAIECFERAGAIRVPRTRFAPVKTTSDLLILRSDAYEITPDWQVRLADERHGTPPTVDLDPEHYRLVDQLDSKFKAPPSLKNCTELRVRGPIGFAENVVIKGKVGLLNPSLELLTLLGGVYENTSLTLTDSWAKA